jgi:hypothetical protein
MPLHCFRNPSFKKYVTLARIGCPTKHEGFWDV